jgi:hypothetical protein
MCIGCLARAERARTDARCHRRGSDETPMLTVHAEGAPIYECKADSGGNLTRQFREPIAALMIDGKTVGRHFAGPSWEIADGSAVMGKVVGRAGTKCQGHPMAQTRGGL